MAPTRRFVALLMALGLAASACSSGASEPIEAAAAPMLDGTFSTLDGTSIDLNDLEGQDVVFWFWAPW